MNLSDDIKKSIAAHAKESTPLECVGIIVALKNGDLEVRRLKNISLQAEYHCLVEGSEIAKATQGDKIVSFYHSHFDSNEFSLEDKAVSERLQIKLVLYCMFDKSFKTYVPNGFVAPYVDRPWVQGVFTCMELLEDYYQKELNVPIVGWDKELLAVEPGDEKHLKTIKLKYIDIAVFYSRARTDEVYAKYVRLVDENQSYKNFMLKNGFRQVKDLRKNDVLLFGSSGLISVDFAIHGAVFLGDNKILHHDFRRRSSVEKFDNRHKSLLKFILRHETLL